MAIYIQRMRRNTFTYKVFFKQTRKDIIIYVETNERCGTRWFIWHRYQPAHALKVDAHGNIVRAKLVSIRHNIILGPCSLALAY